MEEKKYKYNLTEDQYQEIDHLKRMFEVHAENINELCLFVN